jgi:hypothetical protein
MDPPPFNPRLRPSQRFRYAATAAQNVNLNSVRLSAMVGAVATTSSTAALICDFVRIKKVEVRAPVASDGTSASVSLTWRAGPNQLPSEITDSTLSTARNAFVSTKPPKDSLASFWSSVVSATALLDIECPTGSIIDVIIEYQLCDGTTANQVASSGLTVGKLYFEGVSATCKNVALNPFP